MSKSIISSRPMIDWRSQKALSDWLIAPSFQHQIESSPKTVNNIKILTPNHFYLRLSQSDPKTPVTQQVTLS